MKDWKNKKFLINCIEGPHKKNEYFHNGSWFVLKESLTTLLKKAPKPKIEDKTEKRKICMGCDAQSFEVLSYKVRRYQEYEAYHTRDSVLILPSSKLFLNYFELKFPFGSKKEKEIIQRIEANTPSDFKERAEYLYDQAECLEFLKKSNLKTNGHFVTCPKHTNKKSLDNTLKRIIDVSLGEDNKFFFYPYLGNDIISTPCMLDDFLNMHYTKEEVKTRIISTTGIESNIEKHAYLAELD